MNLSNDELNTIALNMIYQSNSRRIQKLGKEILKQTWGKVVELYQKNRDDFLRFADP